MRCWSILPEIPHIPLALNLHDAKCVFDCDNTWHTRTLYSSVYSITHCRAAHRCRCPESEILPCQRVSPRLRPRWAIRGHDELFPWPDVEMRRLRRGNAFILLEKHSCQTHVPIQSSIWLTFISTVAYIFTLKHRSALLGDNLSRRSPLSLRFKAEIPDKMKSCLTSETFKTPRWRGVLGLRCVCKHVGGIRCCMLRRRGGGDGSPPRWTRWPSPHHPIPSSPSSPLHPPHTHTHTHLPSSSVSSAEANFGMGASSSIARLRHSSAWPTGTQSLCRFLGSFTVCQITASPVLSVASQEHLLPTPPCHSLFWIRVPVQGTDLAVNNAHSRVTRGCPLDTDKPYTRQYSLDFFFSPLPKKSSSTFFSRLSRGCHWWHVTGELMLSVASIQFVALF